MPLITVVAGRYSISYQPNASNGASGAGGGALDMGILDQSGIEFSWTSYAQEVRDTDAYGRTLLDTVYQGADWRMRVRCKEYKSANVDAAWPWGRNVSTLSPILGTIARRGSDVVGSVVLVSTAGTPAATNPATVTASTVILSPNTNLAMNFTSQVRELPIEWVLLPYNSAGNNVWFTTT